MTAVTREEVLEYHQLNGKPGKIAVVATKPLETQRDLSLATIIQPVAIWSPWYPMARQFWVWVI